MTRLILPDIQADQWMTALNTRRSRRSYDGVHVDEADLDALNERLESLNSMPQARVALIRSAPADIFTGLVLGSYGRISGAPSALVMLGQTAELHTKECVGFVGQAAILAATDAGLDTCWVGGLFKPGRVSKLIRMRAGERVYAISPLGYAQRKLSGPERRIYRMKDSPKPRRTLDEVAPGWTEWPAWTRPAVEAARIAPSSMNRQPWRFRYSDNDLVVYFDGADTPKTSKRLDCGIAMLNFEVGAASVGVKGEWELLEGGTDVARFVGGPTR